MKEKLFSQNVSKFDIIIDNPLLDCRIFWARVVSSENESLFTQYTKHSFYEIQYALKGRIGILLGDNRTVNVAESEFIIVPPDTYHQIVDSDSVGARFIMAFSMRPKAKAAESLIKLLQVPCPISETPQMKELLSLILSKEYKNDPLTKESIKKLVECFLLDALEKVKENSVKALDDPLRSQKENDTARIKAYIKEHNGIGIGVSDIAKKFNISERQLNRIFNETEGRSLQAVIHTEKLKRIEELVASTSLNFSEIAELCGFSDEYAMNKFFRRHNLTGLTEFKHLADKKRS